MRCTTLVLALAASASAYVMAPAHSRSAGVARSSSPSMASREDLAKKRRQSALITGTNWPPRTQPTPGKGYFFFQGPTPKTAYQKDLPSFFSAENFADISIKPVQLAVTATGLGSLGLIVAGLGGAFEFKPEAAAPADPKAVAKVAAEKEAKAKKEAEEKAAKAAADKAAKAKAAEEKAAKAAEAKAAAKEVKSAEDLSADELRSILKTTVGKKKF